MITRNRLACTCLLLLTACSATSKRPGAGATPSAEFDAAFPEVSVLANTSNVDDVRRDLRAIHLPATRLHWDRLTSVLEATPWLDAEHLLLLTEAVGQDAEQQRLVSSVSAREGNRRWIRSAGPAAKVIDELLLQGVGKVVDPSPENLGLLLSRTQSGKSLAQLVRRCQALETSSEWNNGSLGHLQRILQSCGFDQARVELCLEALLPDDQFSVEAAELALQTMTFDAARLAILEADYARRNRLELEVAIRHVEGMAYDSGRARAAELAAPLLGMLQLPGALRLVKTAGYDEGRVAILRSIADGLRIETPEDALPFLRSASFDDGRRQFLEVLLQAAPLPLTGEDLVLFARQASFDEGRVAILRLAREHLTGELDTESLTELLETVSFDSARNEILQMFRGDIQDWGRADREQILQSFTRIDERLRASGGVLALRQQVGIDPSAATPLNL